MKSAQKAVVFLTLGGLVVGAIVGSVKAVAGGWNAYQATQQLPARTGAVEVRVGALEQAQAVTDAKLDFLIWDVEERTGRRFRVRGTRPR